MHFSEAKIKPTLTAEEKNPWPHKLQTLWCPSRERGWAPHPRTTAHWYASTRQTRCIPASPCYSSVQVSKTSCLRAGANLGLPCWVGYNESAKYSSETSSFDTAGHMALDHLIYNEAPAIPILAFWKEWMTSRWHDMGSGFPEKGNAGTSTLASNTTQEASTLKGIWAIILWLIQGRAKSDTFSWTAGLACVGEKGFPLPKERTWGRSMCWTRRCR